MYQPPHFREERPEVMHALIRAHPLGLLICVGDKGPVANPVPFHLSVDEAGTTVLKAHLARANPAWKIMRDAPETPVLAVFQGPQAYVTPSWYASKAEHGKVVPTWNYAIVQARGLAEITEDRDALHAHLTELTESHETPRAAPWAVTDAPDDYVERQMKGIVGLTVRVSELDGKWKLSQNREARDRAGVIDGYRHDENPDMAALVKAFAPDE